MAIKDILAHPMIYQGFQRAGGFFGARLHGLKDYVKLRGDEVIIDIGCGPGYIREHLPAGVTFFGFDTDQTYIKHAQERFKGRGTFRCEIFDDAVAESLPKADLVMMNGVVHHLDDATADAAFRAIAKVLKPDGKLFTLDGCFRPGQPAFNAWMLRNDRGQFVRDEPRYRALLDKHFNAVDIHIREDISRVPYTFAIALASKAA